MLSDARQCPLAVELNEYIEDRLEAGQADRIGRHVGWCRHCGRILQNLRATSQDSALAGTARAKLESPDPQRSARLRAALAQPQPADVALGQIWRSRVADADIADHGPNLEPVPRLVVVLHADDEPVGDSERAIVVAPVSTETAYRSNLDLLVDDLESPLPFAFMIEVWNEVSTVTPCLARYLGTLPSSLQTALLTLYRARMGADVDLGLVASRVGPPLQGKGDPRLSFREEEIDACAYLRRPLLQQIFAQATAAEEILVSTLGDLIVACEDTIADMIPPTALERLREDRTPVAELRDSARQATLLGAAFTRASVPPATFRGFFNRLREELSFLQPRRARGHVVFTRRQR